MKKINARINLYLAACGILIILLLPVFYLLTPVSKSDTTEFLYIDGDDTQDSVLTKISAFSHTAGLTGLSTLIRHSSYADHIRTGRYAIEPREGAFVIFRHLKNGQHCPGTHQRLRLPTAGLRHLHHCGNVCAQHLRRLLECQH